MIALPATELEDTFGYRRWGRPEVPGRRTPVAGRAIKDPPAGAMIALPATALDDTHSHRS